MAAQPADRQPTVRGLLDAAVARLPPDSARLDAELLLAAALGRTRGWLFAHDRDAVDPADHARFEAMVARRSAGEPVAYVLGEAAFWSMALEVGPSTLVPRPETELLVDTALALLPQAQARVLDLGTGSGAIALALARERPGWRLTGVDIDPAAVAVATRNAARHGLGNAAFLAGSWYGPVQGQCFDLVVSNPPYIREDDPCLGDVGLRFEPRRALASGADGLDALRCVAEGAPAHLLPGGVLACEHGAGQGEPVRALFTATGLVGVHTLQDLAGLDRVTVGFRPGDSGGCAGG